MHFKLATLMIVIKNINFNYAKPYDRMGGRRGLLSNEEEVMVTRILVEKKKGFNVEAMALMAELKSSLHLNTLENLRIINCYDLEDVSEHELSSVKGAVLSEPNVDHVTVGQFKPNPNERAFRIALLPGQFDQRADSAAQCIEIVTLKQRPTITSSKIIVVSGCVSDSDLESIKRFMINPVESHEVYLDMPETLKLSSNTPEAVEIVEGFIELNEVEIETFRVQLGFAMSNADLKHVQNYFAYEEKRNPTITELKVIDTYWSDHCRHTTFMTELENVEIESGPFSKPIQKAYDLYLSLRKSVYADGKRPVSLMDLATINMKALKKRGGLDDLDISDEINACSIKIDVENNGKQEPWLLMFKNETHNHPTEIEPYGGAATCLGGAIRDPLSGRSYVYQSMRVTGSGNPNTPIEDTLEGKLPQRMITQKAAAGFSGYGNQIGLATGHVSEVYDEGFIAKRMEVGAVMGAAPYENVVRAKPEAGDVVVLIGGRTGRDGVGGATGSSKAHDEESLLACGAEVQKGNAPEERKIQRLFRNPALSKMIKKCNDFGAGGVSVAIGELADSLDINLDAVPKKYEGLDGTELAISESQERMAVVIAPRDLDAVIGYCQKENLEATVVAKVEDNGRLVMRWHNQYVLDLSRAFLDTNGVKGVADAYITAPSSEHFFAPRSEHSIKEQWIQMLSDLNVCSQKGLVERFDNTIGSGTVLMPFGGHYALTPSQTMVSKLPTLGFETDTVSMMSYGYNPNIGKWSPFHGGLYAVVESMAKLVAVGGDYKKARLSLQEYFEKLGTDSKRWGKPLAALLGASYAQDAFGTAAIGGKDSMSGSFKALDVPPTLISFAVSHGLAGEVVSQEIKRSDSKLICFYAKRDESELVDFEVLKEAYDEVLKGIHEGSILSAYAVGIGGVAAAVSKMAFGNKIGVKLNAGAMQNWFEEAYGSLVFETKDDWNTALEGFVEIGRTQKPFLFEVEGAQIDGEVSLNAWTNPLETVFPTVAHEMGHAQTYSFEGPKHRKASIQIAKPKVFIPVFPGTNCEYDTERAFLRAGADVETLVFRNMKPNDVSASIEAFIKQIRQSQIIAIPGGFSAGDEPEGSGKFIASVFRNPRIAEAVMDLLKNRDGLMLGICNGFQALVKLGLLPYGEIRELDETSPTLTFNKIGRHVARMADVRIASTNSPWLMDRKVGEIYKTAFSHGEGRFYSDNETLQRLAKQGQIATQYVDEKGRATYDGRYNINGSIDSIEGIFSPDGRVFGKMGHVERVGKNLYKNIDGNLDMDIFTSGVNYYK